MFPPALLAPALLDAADRLITTLMSLVDAIYPIALNGSTPTLSDHAANTLFGRLSTLIATLIRLTNIGHRTPAKPATTPDRIPPPRTAERSPPDPAQPLPRHRGWLLDALPDIAPAVAADLAALLADPSLAALLAAAPTLERALRPLLRSLGITQPPPPPAPSPPLPPPAPNRPMPLTPAPTRHPSSVPNPPRNQPPLHAQIITITQ